MTYIHARPSKWELRYSGFHYIVTCNVHKGKALEKHQLLNRRSNSQALTNKCKWIGYNSYPLVLQMIIKITNKNLEDILPLLTLILSIKEEDIICSLPFETNNFPKMSQHLLSQNEHGTRSF